MKLFLIDGSALAYRSHFAFITNPLKTSSGMVTSAIFGFTSTVLKLIEKEKPDFLAVITDSREKTFRHGLYPDYKATREKMPDDLSMQLSGIEQMMAALSIPYIGVPTFEADDIIGTFAKQAYAENIETFIVSSDKDFLQLLNDKTWLYSIKKGETEILDETGSEKKWGIKKDHVVDFMALMGDSSDHIPGVPGVGEKTALKLIQEYQSLDGIYENIEKVTPKKLQENLITHKEQAYLCKDLVTIHKDVPLTFDLSSLRVKPPNHSEAIKLIKTFELSSLVNYLKAPTTPVQTPVSMSRYRLCESEKDFMEATQELKTSELISFALSDGFLCFSAKPSEAIALPESLATHAKSLLEDATLAKCTFDLKNTLKNLTRLGVDLKGVCFDPMIESYLIYPENRQFHLDAMALQTLKVTKEHLLGAQSICENADLTLRLHHSFKEKMKSLELEKLYLDIELPVAKVLSQMETKGIALNSEHLKHMGVAIQKRLEELTAAITAMAGEAFNLNSPKQLGVILFEKINIQSVLPSKKIKKTKTGYSTDQETLENYSEHPIIKLILEYRNLSKLNSTYVTSLPLLVNPVTHRIHTSFNQTVAATGRLSSSDPNLQNIPIRTDLGKDIRKAFIAGTKGWNIVSADYSQIELRILAHLSKDPTLLDTFIKNEDVHKRTASVIFNQPLAEVTSQLRSQAKAINFGIIYGMGPQRLAKETGISLAEAKDFIQAYFEKYSHIKAYLNSQIEFAKEHGFVRTLLGRNRPLPDIHSKNPMLYSNAERMATNTPIQGSAADLIKVAMIHIQEALIKNKMASAMLLQVHDELVFESPPDETEALKNLVKHIMETSTLLDVPLRVDTGVGDSWATAH